MVEKLNVKIIQNLHTIYGGANETEEDFIVEDQIDGF